MQKLFAILKAAGGKATGWKTTAIGVAICALGAGAYYHNEPELAMGFLAVGVGFVFGVADPKKDEDGGS